MRPTHGTLERLSSYRLRGQTHRVMLALLPLIHFDRDEVVPLDEIGAHLGLSVPHVGRALGELVTAGLIQRGPRQGRRATYRLTGALADVARPRSATPAPDPRQLDLTREPA